MHQSMHCMVFWSPHKWWFANLDPPPLGVSHIGPVGMGPPCLAIGWNQCRAAATASATELTCRHKCNNGFHKHPILGDVLQTANVPQPRPRFITIPTLSYIPYMYVHDNKCSEWHAASIYLSVSLFLSFLSHPTHPTLCRFHATPLSAMTMSAHCASASQ
jgi:hypothetical protein